MNTDPVGCVYVSMKRFPLVTLALIFANLLAFKLELATGGIPACREYGLIPAHFAPITLVTSLFFHDPTTIVHLAGNMAALALAGSVVEAELGPFLFASLYFASGIAGGLMHANINPSSTVPLIGASGAIFGVFAVLGVLHPRLLGFVVGMAALNIWAAFRGAEGNVSFGCHIGGLCAGTAFAFFCRPVEEAA